MAKSGTLHPPTHLIACGVFRAALEHLQLQRKHPQLRLTFLTSKLHLRPKELEVVLSQEIISSQERHERTVCLYGMCFPNIDDCCGRHGAKRVPGLHCYEMLLGREKYQHIIEETPGTYFVERDIILNFDEFCLSPLELHDKEMLRWFFSNYQKVLYLRQPSDPDLLPRVHKLADFLQLSLVTRDADYSEIERMLLELI